MNTMEDRARAAMRAIASTVEDAPPLRLEPARRTTGRARRTTRWGRGAPTTGWARRTAGWARGARGWLVPLTAAVTMLAVGITLAIVRNAPSGPALPAVPPFSDGVPRYYVALDGPTGINPAPAKVVVGDTITGKRLLTLGPFAGGGAVSVTAAADDLTFVVGTGQYHAPAPPTPTSWSVIQLTPGPPVSATVRALSISVPASGFIDSSALSPDGTMLATVGTQGASIVLRIYSMATGAVLRTWTESVSGSPILAFASSLWWSNDERTLAWVGGGSGGGRNFGVWLLQLDRPGQDLLADSRLAWSTGMQSDFDPESPRAFSCAGFAPSVLLTGDGKTIVCGALGVFRVQGNRSPGTCPAGVPVPGTALPERAGASPPTGSDLGFLEYSTATGKLADTLYRDETSCSPESTPAQVLWVSATGGTVIGFFDYTVNLRPVILFGIFREGKFTPLPVPVSTGAGTIAW